jgi:hypothetical protein
VCCIDEFGCTKQEDRTTIHEAMEQQTISVAKAGLVSTLNTRCTIIAALNPVGDDYDLDLSVSANCHIESALLSRFDLVFLMLDTLDEALDRKICAHIFEQKRVLAAVGDGEEETDATIAAAAAAVTASQESTASSVRQLPHSTEGVWSEQLLQCYFHYVKTAHMPTVSKYVEKMIMRYYLLQRQATGDNRMPATIRTLESIIRLCQAHARLMFRSCVLPLDVVQVILLMEVSAYSIGSFQAFTFNGRDLPHDPVVFESLDPDDLYLRQESVVISRLGLRMPKDKHRVYDYKKAFAAPEPLAVPSDAPAPSPSPLIVTSSPMPSAKRRKHGSRDGTASSFTPVLSSSSSSSSSSFSSSTQAPRPVAPAVSVAPPTTMNVAFDDEFGTDDPFAGIEFPF